VESQLSKFSKLSFLVSVLFEVGLIRLWPHYDANAKFPEHPEAIHLARSLAFHQQFADPFRLVATGPSAYLSRISIFSCPAHTRFQHRRRSRFRISPGSCDG
jgi:hypothetical protein